MGPIHKSFNGARPGIRRRKMGDWFLAVSLCRLATMEGADWVSMANWFFTYNRPGRGKGFAAAALLAVGLAVAATPAVAQEDAWEEFAIGGVEAFNRGDFAEAAEGFARALVIARGFEHSDQRLITSLANLGMVYQRLELFDDAEPMYQEAIRIQESTLGPRHPDLSATLSSLAELYMAQQKWADAEPLLTQALEIREAAAGPNHPFTGLVVFTLGEIALAQENWQQAVARFSRVFTIRQQNFGAVHQSLIYPLTRLGIAFHALGDLEQAELSFSQALEIWNTVPLPVSPEYLMTLEAAAALFRAVCQRERGTELEATAADIRELL